MARVVPKLEARDVGVSSPKFPRYSRRVNRVGTAVLAVLGIVFMSQTGAAQTVYEDGTFDLVNWNEYGPFLFPADLVGGDLGSSQLSGDGNPSNHLRFEIEGVPVPLGTSTSAWGILINDTAVYDPAVTGAIQAIDFNFDGRLPPGESGTRVLSLAVEQDTYRWAAIAKRAFVANESWLPEQITGLVAADFTPHTWGEPGQPANPDFSATGSPIAFGVATGTSCPASADCSGPAIPIAVDIDNWKVTVDSGSTDPFVVTVIEPDGSTDLQYDFGAYEIGIETRRTFVIRNDGSMGISVLSYDNIVAPFVGPFLSTFSGIAPGNTGDFTIGFNPTQVGTFNGQVDIVFAHDVTTLSLAGQGVASGARADIATDIVNDPSDPTDDLMLEFGTIVLGDSREGRITVTNGGGATLDVDDIIAFLEVGFAQGEPIVLDTIDPDAPFVVDNGCKELFMSPGESCLMRVIFRPEAPGFVANALTILFGSDLDSRFSETILLTGSTATESPIGVTDSIDPPDDRELAFGPVDVGEVRTGTVFLANLSDEPASIGSLAGMLMQPFFLEDDTCSSTVLQPIQECSFSVRFAPEVSELGFIDDPVPTFQQQVAIPIEAPDAMTVSVDVTGRLPADAGVPQDKGGGNLCDCTIARRPSTHPIVALLLLAFALRRRLVGVRW